MVQDDDDDDDVGAAAVVGLCHGVIKSYRNLYLNLCHDSCRSQSVSSLGTTLIKNQGFYS
jgi:hypothetical protein